MALLRKSIRRVSLNIAGRIRGRNKSAGGTGAKNNTGGGIVGGDAVDGKNEFDLIPHCGLVSDLKCNESG